MTEIPGMPAQQQRASEGRDPRGWLTFDGPLPDDLARAEDSTQVTDKERRLIRGQWRGFQRPVTDTERQLLEHLGHVLPDDLVTQVSWPTVGTHRRVWPQLEQETTS